MKSRDRFPHLPLPKPATGGRWRFAGWGVEVVVVTGRKWKFTGWGMVVVVVAW